ncbi:twin-arginine translocase TatA/TatE family subunit [Demequina pelophila]|uniref:twin-arginine translocase TatA/TatE family subunit n=1 Tax=Demequina pelophila TaxID=1638984 RepID=UPI00078030F3|nr:twin-arginine translocase TatA/TatE family subunit [Demequina pelophila]
MGSFGAREMLIILVIVLLLFGAPKLPQLARSLGQSMRILKDETSQMRSEGKDAGSGASTGGPATDADGDQAPSSDEPREPRQ